MTPAFSAFLVACSVLCFDLFIVVHPLAGIERVPDRFFGNVAKETTVDA